VLLNVVDDDGVEAADEEGEGKDDTDGGTRDGLLIHAAAGGAAIPLG
jgi:hypothetical protein